MKRSSSCLTILAAVILFVICGGYLTNSPPREYVSTRPNALAPNDRSTPIAAANKKEPRSKPDPAKSKSTWKPRPTENDKTRRATQILKELSESDNFRVWTTKNGKHKTRAKYVKYVSGSLTLEKENGDLVKNLRLYKLSDADREFVTNIVQMEKERWEMLDSHNVHNLEQYIDQEVALIKRRNAEDAKQSPSSAPSIDRSRAWVYAKDHVKNPLKSPSSANFGWQSASDTVEILGNNRYRVTGYVDAENAFGGNIRSTFSCDVEIDDKSWNCTNLMIRSR